MWQLNIAFRGVPAIHVVQPNRGFLYCCRLVGQAFGPRAS